MADALSASLEDYLEGIYNIINEKRAARSKDISALLHVTGASVTGALHQLAHRGLVNYEPYEYITLTPEGEKVAEQLINSHNRWKDFFVDILKIDPELADSTACALEHVVSTEVMERLNLFMKVLQTTESGNDCLDKYAKKCQGKKCNVEKR